MTMAIEATSEVVPLEFDENGAARVGGTRVTLDTIIAAFSDGATAEEIAQQYPSLELADIYQLIAYYLRRRSEVEAYLHKRAVQAGETRKKNESRFDPQGIRDRLLARLA